MENLDKNWHKSFWELQLAKTRVVHILLLLATITWTKQSLFLYEPTYYLIKDSYLKT